MTRKAQLRNAVAWSLLPMAAPFLCFYSRKNRNQKMLAIRAQLDKLGMAVVPYTYYDPVYTSADLIRDPAAARTLEGIDWNEAGQLKLLDEFSYAGALRHLDGRSIAGRVFRYDNVMFGPGDAEALYCMVRRFRPGRLVEIGCGNSTLVAEMAIEDNRKEDPNYRCRHICIEPFENPWLETLGIEIRREKVERCDLGPFRALEAGDILFIDSSHALRPMGDVEFEYLHILPVLTRGVIVHAHDIFSPRDYPREWLENDRLLWTEQYLLEAFLSFNSEFEILCALNDLSHKHPQSFARAFPVLSERGSKINVGSFWFRRKP
jgi:hypothetical protein